MCIYTVNYYSKAYVVLVVADNPCKEWEDIYYSPTMFDFFLIVCLLSDGLSVKLF